LGKIGDKIKPPGVETWSVNRQQIPRDVPVPMSPVPVRGFAVSVLPITGGVMNCPVVFFQQQPNVLTTVQSGNLSRTRAGCEEVKKSMTISSLPPRHKDTKRFVFLCVLVPWWPK
jgi:hypothetical protein